MIGMCSYKSFQTDYVAVDEGNGIGNCQDYKTLDECETLCHQTDGCESFAYGTGASSCCLKDKTQNSDQPTQENPMWTTYYYECDAGTNLY